MAWSPDGKRLATGSRDSTAKVWDAATGKELLTLSGHEVGVSSVAWSPDGKRLATGSEDNTAKVWDAETGRGTADPERPRETALRAWPGARTGSGWRRGVGTHTAKVWDAETGRELLTLSGHSGICFQRGLEPGREAAGDGE